MRKAFESKEQEQTQTKPFDDLPIVEPETKDYICPNCGQPCTKDEYESGYCLDCDQIEMFGE